jgi:hypothetical protein
LGPREFQGQGRIEWFAEKYPKLKPGSINAHLVQASTNDPSRLHHIATNSTDDLLFRVGSREYRLYEAGKDPAPIHLRNKVQVQVPSLGGGTVTVMDNDNDDDSGSAVDAALAGSSQSLELGS